MKLFYIIAEVLYYVGDKFDWKWASDKSEELNIKYRLDEDMK